MWSNRDFDSKMLLCKFDFSFYIIDSNLLTILQQKKKKKLIKDRV